ncbi:hypothetical protein F2Q70_00001695 [Brassica cretica]|uniref:Uncharacterized protein n=1 Tax=Brassica cretica TaxID=69181 RepID=A0A8S9IPD0_BRACR|nr:hypothetical protein F2Q70_00001695 [Brassica cretica]
MTEPAGHEVIQAGVERVPRRSRQDDRSWDGSLPGRKESPDELISNVSRFGWTRQNHYRSRRSSRLQRDLRLHHESSYEHQRPKDVEIGLILGVSGS